MRSQNKKKTQALSLSLPFEELILLALGSGNKMSSQALRAKLTAELHRPITPGAFYTTLKRLEGKRLLTKQAGKRHTGSASFQITSAGVDQVTFLANLRARLISGKADPQ